MADNICSNCGNDNLTDYPVCPACAQRVHFTNRDHCQHCIYERIVEQELNESAPELNVQPIRDFAEARGLNVTLLEEYVKDQRSKMRRQVICPTCNDEGVVWVEGSPRFDNPAGDFQEPCECRQMRQAFHGDEFYGINQEVPF